MATTTSHIQSIIREDGKKMWIIDLSPLNDHPDLVKRMVADVKRNKAKMEQERHKGVMTQP